MVYKPLTYLRAHQIDQLHSLYKNEFWCNARTKPDIEKMLKHSSIIIAFEDATENLIAFCRLLTDYTYKATLYDLIVHPDYRGKQLGKLVMDAVFRHPELMDVEHIDLNCLPEMKAFYQHWGFTDEVGELIHMRYFSGK